MRSGSSFQSLAKEQQEALGASGTAGEALACLAVAEGKAEICDSLSPTSKGYCSLTVDLAQHLKGVPKKHLRAYVLNFYCLRGGTNKGDCEKGLAIMTSGDSTRCKELSTDLQRQMCVGILKGDAKVCDRLEKPDDRMGCSMLVAPDASRCPKDSKPCQIMARMMKTIDTGGLEALQDIEPALAAVQKGRQACGTVLANLESSCKGTSNSTSAKAAKEEAPKK